MVDFSKLLDKPADDIKRPPALPAGTYNGIVGQYEFGESSQKKTPFVRYYFNITGAGEDIDEDDLEGIDLSKKQLRREFYITDDALFMLKEFIESCGIQTSGRSLAELVPEAQGQPVIIEVSQEMNQNDPTMPPRNNVQNVKGEAATE